MIEFSRGSAYQPGIGSVKAAVSLIQGFYYNPELCNLGKDLSKE